MPSSVQPVGMLARCDSSITCSSAPEMMTPRPTSITGRFASPISWAMRRSFIWSGAGASGNERMRTGSVHGTYSVSACCRSLGRSTSTGPGRPERATWNASWRVGAMSSTRVTR